MPETIDFPPSRRHGYSGPDRPERPFRWRYFLVVFALILAVILGGRTAISYYVDALWYSSLGYGEVFWKTLSTQWLVFAVFTEVTFLILYGSFLGLERLHSSDLPVERS